MHEVELVSLPRIPYLECWGLQRERVMRCRQEGIGAVIFVEHPPVITLGRAGKRSSLLVTEAQLQAAGIELVHADRGGDITYHGPGQLVVYPILNLALWKKDVHWYLRALEEVIITTLSDFDIMGYRSSLGAGVWADHPNHGPAKIASIGIHLSRWVTSHGVALNVCNSLEPFRYIVPCGLTGVRITSMSNLLGRTVARPAVETTLWEHLMAQFDLSPSRCEQPATRSLGACDSLSDRSSSVGRTSAG
ncbi:MAG: lipoyl(octanoyl) transferase LipB [Acidobacteria bacterium]|nr:lipoyl(octanoyl) transferase LipB [Acidobacteriota bacterium]